MKTAFLAFLCLLLWTGAPLAALVPAGEAARMTCCGTGEEGCAMHEEAPAPAGDDCCSHGPQAPTDSAPCDGKDCEGCRAACCTVPLVAVPATPHGLPAPTERLASVSLARACPPEAPVHGVDHVPRK